MTSLTEQFVINALSEFPGLSRDQILSVIAVDWGNAGFTQNQGKQMPVLARVLNGLVDDGKIINHGDKYYLAKQANGTSNGAIPSQVTRRAIADFYRSRATQTITIEHSPVVVPNVHQVCLVFADQRIPLPPGDYRLCVRGEIPTWSANQIVFRGVSAIVIIFADGKEELHNHNPNQPITALLVDDE